MTSLNLTRTEAAARAELISDLHYSIDLDLSHAQDAQQRLFDSTTTVRFTSGAGSTFLDLRAKEVAQVTVDGKDVTATAVPVVDGAYDAAAGIQLQGLSAGEHEVMVTARIPYSTTGQGLHRFFDPADGHTYMYTQFETADAKRVFACFDQPDLKATYDVQLTTPKEWTVVTNNVVSTEPVRDGEADEGLVRHTSTVDYLLSTYLVAFCVGPWHVVRDEWSGTITEHEEMKGQAAVAAQKRGTLQTSGELSVPLAIYCRQSLAEYLDADELFTVTKQGFDWYAEHFGVAYPFYKYDQIFCPEYNMGAMENAGAVTIRDEYIFRSAASHYQYERRADTVLHELAHMWFGDLVTMKWWDDLWLNESFATWSAAMSQSEATRYTTAWVTFANKEKAWAYGQDQLSSTHPVFSDASDIETVEANFDGITYAKGASLLKQLAAYVGLDAFLSGLRSHFAAHAWSNATFDDLLKALEAASGRDLSDWANQWLRTTGINTLSPQFEVADGAYSSFSVAQSGAVPGAGETRTHRIAVGVYAADESGQLVRTHRAELDIAGEVTEVPELVGVPAGDLVLVNDDDLAYGFMALDEGSLAQATQNIDRFADPMPRSLVWSAAWQMTRNAQMRARDFVELVCRGAAAETELAVLEQVLAQGRAAVERYADPVWAADTGWAMLREAYLAGARSTTGQAQLAFLRAFADCAHSAESAEILKALLGEESGNAPGDVAAANVANENVPAVDVDQDLRWALITALNSSTRVTGESVVTAQQRIDREKESDTSSTGAMCALEANAAIPDADIKHAAWQELTVEAPQQTNLALRHTNAGLIRPGQGDLMEPFGPAYVTGALDWWKALDSEMALRTLEGIYPDWDHSESTDQAIANIIADDDTPSGLKRVLKEGRDRVARAKAARAKDASPDAGSATGAGINAEEAR